MTALKPKKNSFSLSLLLVLSTISFSQGAQIDEEGFVRINGIEQWISIKGDMSKPAILFLHGGPGSTMSPYSDSMFAGWHRHFIIIHWDQRGAGKTFGRSAPEELSPGFLTSNPLSVDVMIEDGIKVAEYLVKRLEKKKVILFGTSWGSVLGIQMAGKRPDLFSAYIGHSQVVYPSDNMGLAYRKVLAMAEKSGDVESQKLLASIGTPPYDTARHAGLLLRIIKNYERQNSTPEPSSWFTVSPAYASEKDALDREAGDDYSFVNFVGDKHLGVIPMPQPVSRLHFTIPLYLIQGREDILTPQEVSRAYFDKITAPEKEYVLLPESAHGFNRSVIKTMFQIFAKIE